MKKFPDLPPLWLLATMFCAWAIARFGPTLMVHFGPLHLFGQGIALAGTGLIFWSIYWFWTKKTTIEPHHKPGVLIKEGPFRFSRNPIYLGMVAILVGQVLWMGAVLAALVVPIFVFILVRRFVMPEETALLEAFGPQGQEYLAITRRWF